MWIIAGLPFDPSLHTKVKEALNDRLQVVEEGSSYSPFSLSWLGYDSGDRWDYTISGWYYGNGSVVDSVFAVGTIDSVGTCYKPGTEIAFLTSVGTSDSGAINDTFFMYFDGALYSEGGVMVAKYNAATGDSWEAWDTCLIGPLNTRFPIGDIDGDLNEDSAWVEASPMRAVNATSSELETHVAPLTIGVWASALASSYGIDSIIIYEYDRHLFLIGEGKAETHTDSVRYVYFMYGSPAIDTVYPDAYHKILNVAVSERPEISRASLTVSDGFVTVAYEGDYTLSIYSSAGRLVRRYVANRPATYPLPANRGVMFVVLRTDRGALIKPYVR